MRQSVPTPLSRDFDLPDRVDDQLDWLADAGFKADCVWTEGDIAVLSATKPPDLSPMTTTSRIYLDFNASTPVAPEIVDAMVPFLTTVYGNPSSAHWASKPAKEALEHARADVATLIDASPEEVVFTRRRKRSEQRGTQRCVFQEKDHSWSTSCHHHCDRASRRSGSLQVSGVAWGEADPPAGRFGRTP